MQTVAMESMDREKDNLTGQKEQQQRYADSVGSAIVLAFPTAQQDPAPHLAPLHDKHSNYTAVAKACLQLNQFALNGSSSTLDDVNSGIAHSMLVHDQNLATIFSDAFAGLIDCLQNHQDRRAKVLSSRTLAQVARAAQGKLRHAPQMYAVRDSRNSRLEDEVGTDVPMALATSALEDTDDGVAASALQALGTIVLSSGTSIGNLVEDELLLELSGIIQHGPTAYAPTLSDLEHEDSDVTQAVLQTRVLENVINPRMLQLVSRVVAFEQDRHVEMVLPILVSSLVHLSKTVKALYSINREAYTKRWVEVDYVNLLTTVVEMILLPGMRCGHGHLAHACAMSSIRLLHECPTASWVERLTSVVILTLKEELCSNSINLEACTANLGALIICSRLIPLPDRSPILSDCFGMVRALPSTATAPYGIHSAGLLLEAHGQFFYRRPTRIALLAEIALSFFVDGPTEPSPAAKYPRSNSLEGFLKSSDVISVMTETQSENWIQLGQELTFAFCTVASSVGRKHKSGVEINDGGPDDQYQTDISTEDFYEWVRMSIIVLDSFMGCLSWVDGQKSYMDEELSGLVAAQASYARLVQELTHGAGLMSSTSIALNIAPSATPPSILWDQMEDSALFLEKCDSAPISDTGLLERVGKIMNAFVKRELKDNGISSHHLRHYLLTMCADQWVQARRLGASKEGERTGSPSIEINSDGVDDLLQALCPRRAFSKVVEAHKNQIETFSKKKKELYKKYAQDTLTVCVACIENIALAAIDWAKRFGKSAKTQGICDSAVAALEGKHSGASDSPILPVCQGAIERIESALSSDVDPTSDLVSVSPLVQNAPELRPRPSITATRSNRGKRTYSEGYMVQLSRLVVASRIDKCLLSVPGGSVPRGARRAGWLRLSLPPLPECRHSQGRTLVTPNLSLDAGARLSSGGSDAATMNLSYAVRRNMRYDGENEFRLAFSLRVHNITAVDIPEGLRLTLGFSQEAASTSVDGQDKVSMDILKSLSEGNDIFVNEPTLTSAMAMYKQELPSGDHLTWEVIVDPLPISGAMSVRPSIQFRAVEDEAPHSTWILADGSDDENEDKSATSGVSQHSSTSKNESDNKGKEFKRNILIPGEEMKLSPMIGLQPCPFVFFRDGRGDIEAFRYLWSSVPYQVTPLQLLEDEGEPVFSAALYRKLAALSSVSFSGNKIPGGAYFEALGIHVIDRQTSTVRFSAV